MSAVQFPRPSRATRPTFLVVHVEPEMLDRIEGELQRGFGYDFRICEWPSLRLGDCSRC